MQKFLVLVIRCFLSHSLKFLVTFWTAISGLDCLEYLSDARSDARRVGRDREMERRAQVTRRASRITCTALLWAVYNAHFSSARRIIITWPENE